MQIGVFKTMTEFIAIPSITIICYLVAEAFKGFVTTARHKHIPALCGIVGLALGAVSYLAVPGFIPATNIIDALAIGIVSGFAATGVHQLYRQEAGKSSGDGK